MQFSALLGHAAGSSSSVAGTYSHLFSSAAAASVGADTKSAVSAMPIFWYNQDLKNATSSSEESFDTSSETVFRERRQPN